MVFDMTTGHVWCLNDLALLLWWQKALKNVTHTGMQLQWGTQIPQLVLLNEDSLVSRISELPRLSVEIMEHHTPCSRVSNVILGVYITGGMLARNGTWIHISTLKLHEQISLTLKTNPTHPVKWYWYWDFLPTLPHQKKNWNCWPQVQSSVQKLVLWKTSKLLCCTQKAHILLPFQEDFMQDCWQSIWQQCLLVQKPTFGLTFFSNTLQPDMMSGKKDAPSVQCFKVFLPITVLLGKEALTIKKMLTLKFPEVIQITEFFRWQPGKWHSCPCLPALV